MCHIWHVTSYAEAITANIRAERARKHMSQAGVAEGMRAYGFTNWRRPTVSRVEYGYRQILAVELLALADVFGVPATVLLPQQVLSGLKISEPA